MARRRFNRNQPRDKNGRWKSGAGSSAKRPSVKKSAGALSNSDLGKQAVGQALGAAFAVGTGRPVQAGIHAVGVATNLYRVGSNVAAKRVANNAKLTSAQKRNFTVKRKNVDNLVDKVETAQKVALAGSAIFGLAATGAGLYNMNKASNASAGGVKVLKALGSGGAGLKAAKSARGVYKITKL